MAAFGGYYAWHNPQPQPAEMGELEWLRQEFKLNDEQFARVQEIHARYEPICESLCSRVIDARERLDRKLVAAPAYSAEIEEELSHFSRVKEDCHRAMLQHLYEVAEVMEPEERVRYLDKAKAQVTMHDRLSP